MLLPEGKSCLTFKINFTLGEDVGKGKSPTLLQPLWKIVWKFLKNLKIELTYDPAIPVLGIYLEKTKTLIQKDTCTPVFIAALFIIAKTWKQPKCPPTDEWIKKMWYIYTLVY